MGLSFRSNADGTGCVRRIGSVVHHDVIPLNRYGSTEEIANVVGFLCSPQATYVNGQVLAVDGVFEASGVGLPTLRKNGW